MKKASLQILLALTLLAAASLSHAQIALPGFKNLCAYDSSCRKVGKIKDKEFVIKRIPDELINYYQRLQPAIIRIANEYNIDPVTLVLAPLAENTMNVNKTDEIQAELVRSGAAPEAVFLGMEMSVGPGQIYPSSALKAEKLAAQIEGRKVRTKKEITQKLLTPEGALRYAAAIMRQAQDIYAANGFDISKRPEILATLYNIGRPAERVQNTIRTKRMPYPNYFGYYVGKQYDHVRELLNLPSVLD